MALRTPDFHTVSPDGVAQDRAAMEQYTTGLLNGIKNWNTIELTIDDLEIAGDTAIVTLSQHLDRAAARQPSASRGDLGRHHRHPGPTRSKTSSSPSVRSKGPAALHVERFSSGPTRRHLTVG